jgi:hypothetical protein
LHLVGILFPHIIDDARSKPHQIYDGICRGLLQGAFPKCQNLKLSFPSEK